MNSLKVKNRINGLFRAKEKEILSVYFTAGYPKINDTIPIIRHLERSGVDLIEVGIPFSDPVADGATIQKSNQQALKNGMTLPVLFDQLKNVRKDVKVPLILMGYLNPILQYGIVNFCKACQNMGIDGLIIPDLPMYEYLTTMRPVFDEHGLLNIFLISPNTTEARIREIDDNSDGFIYMVSSASITGVRSVISDEQLSYFHRVRQMELKNKTLIGFGISNHETFLTACDNASGAIIGSAFINMLSKSQSLESDICQFVKKINRA